jgi:hypothetical protein
MRDAAMNPVTELLAERLDEITAEIVGEIAGRVPAYTGLSAAMILTLVRDALTVYTGAQDRGAALDHFRRLGAHEARAGQDVRHLESALRSGARVLIRRTANAAARVHPPNTEFIAVMESAFSAEDQIVEAAVDGHHRAARPRNGSRLYPLVARGQHYSPN